MNINLDTDWLRTTDDENYKELLDLRGAIQSEKWHPEGDAFTHTMMVMDAWKQLVPDFGIDDYYSDGLAYCMCHDLGKALTKDIWPKHHKHELLGIKPTRNLLSRFGFTEDKILVGEIVTKYHMHTHKVFELRPITFIRCLKDIEKHLKYDRDLTLYGIKMLCSVSYADHYGRGGVDIDSEYDNADVFYLILTSIFKAKLNGVDIDSNLFNKYLTEYIRLCRGRY